MAVGTVSGHPAKLRWESRRTFTADPSTQDSDSEEAVVSGQDSDLAGASVGGSASATDTHSGPSDGIPGGTTRIGIARTGTLRTLMATTPATTAIRITAKTGRIVRPRIAQVPGLKTIRTQIT